MMDNATWIKILSKGVITIPKEFREAINLKDGDIAKAWIEGNRLILEPFRGSLGAEEPQVQVAQEPLQSEKPVSSPRVEAGRQEKPAEPMDVLERINKLEETQKMPILNPDTGRPWDAVDKTDSQKETSQYQKEQDDLKKLLESWRAKGEALEEEISAAPDLPTEEPTTIAQAPQPIAAYEQPTTEWNNPFVREEVSAPVQNESQIPANDTMDPTNRIIPTTQLPEVMAPVEPAQEVHQAPTELWNPVVEETSDEYSAQTEPVAPVSPFQNPQDYLYNPQQTSHIQPEEEEAPVSPVTPQQNQSWNPTQAPSAPSYTQQPPQAPQTQSRPNNGFQFPPLKTDEDQTS